MYADKEANAASPKSNSITNTMESFDPLFTKLKEIVARTQSCADRLQGGRGEPTDKDGVGAPTPGHLIAQLNQRRTFLAKLVHNLDNELVRIEIGIS